MKKRFVHMAIYVVAIIAWGIAYSIWCRLNTLRIPCVFHELTGLYCSGCGVTRMCLALIELDFKMAFYSNRALFICLPIGLILGIQLLVQYVKVGNFKLSLRQTRGLWAIIIFLVIFGVLRNIPSFYYLRPMV